MLINLIVIHEQNLFPGPDYALLLNCTFVGSPNIFVGAGETNYFQEI